MFQHTHTYVHTRWSSIALIESMARFSTSRKSFLAQMTQLISIRGLFSIRGHHCVKLLNINSTAFDIAQQDNTYQGLYRKKGEAHTQFVQYWSSGNTHIPWCYCHKDSVLWYQDSLPPKVNSSEHLRPTVACYACNSFEMTMKGSSKNTWHEVDPEHTFQVDLTCKGYEEESNQALELIKQVSRGMRKGTSSSHLP